ncbi:MAG: hypothetical protein HDR11_09685 [Lachnospiraceae bacterium]|nr:hypothetical protein [Lachnospiraceae bacterium]
MSKGLKGITVKIDGDATGINQALSGTNATAKSLSGELKGVNSLLKFDPSNTELLAQKQEILKQSITNTEEKLKLLKQAQEEVAEAGKDINDEGYRDLQREIAATQQKLTGYKTQLKNTEEQQKKAAKEAETLGNKIYKIASHIPIVNKLANGFVNAKQKITETVKESETVKKIGTAVESAKQKVEAFKDAHPAVKKVADAFHGVKEKADELKNKLPSAKQALEAVGNAAQAAASGGMKALTAAAGSTMKAFAGFSAAIAGAATAVAGYAVSQAETLDEIDKMSQRLGMSREEYQKWDFVLSQSGVDITSFQTGMKSLTKNMDAVTEGNKTAIENFQKLGVSVTNADGSLRGQEETLLDVVKAFQSMPESTEKARLAQELFGKQGQEIMPLLNSETGSVEELMQKCEDLGIIIGDDAVDAGVEFTDTLDQLKRSAQGIFNTFASTGILKAFTDAMKTAMGAISNLLNAYKTGGVEGLLKEADNTIGELTQQAADKIAASAPKLIDTASNIIKSLIASLANNIPTIIDGVLPPLINGFFTLVKAVTATLPTMLPQVLDAAITLFGGLLQGLQDTIPTLLAMLPTLIKTISQTLIANLPQLVRSGVQILTSLISGITQTIPTLITEIIGLIPVIVQAIMENLPYIVEAGLNLLLSLVSGIAQAIPQLVEMLPTIIDTIVSNLVSMFPAILDTGTQLLDSLVSGIVQAIPKLVAALPQVIVSAVNTIIKNLPKIIQAGIELIGSLISGIIKAIPTLLAALPQVFSAIINAFKEIDWLDLGKNLIDGVINGIKNAASSLINVFKDLAKQALDAIKNFFGIHSPSRVMRDEVGKMLPAGMAEGVEEGMDDEEKRIQESMKRGVPTTIDGYIKSGGSRTGSEAEETQAGGFVQNLTINSPRELNPSETARLNRKATQQMILKIKPA